MFFNNFAVTAHNSSPMMGNNGTLDTQLRLRIGFFVFKNNLAFYTVSDVASRPEFSVKVFGNEDTLLISTTLQGIIGNGLSVAINSNEHFCILNTIVAAGQLGWIDFLGFKDSGNKHVRFSLPLFVE